MKSLEFESETSPTDETQIRKFESLIGFSLPETYRSFLLKTNGGVPSNENRLFTIRDNPEFHPDFNEVEVEFFYEVQDEEKHSAAAHAYEIYRGRIPASTIPFARDPFGNLFLLGISGAVRNQVFFWDHEQEGFDRPDDMFHNCGKLADSFESFVDALVEA